MLHRRSLDRLLCIWFIDQDRRDIIRDPLFDANPLVCESNISTTMKRVAWYKSTDEYHTFHGNLRPLESACTFVARCVEFCRIHFVSFSSPNMRILAITAVIWNRRPVNNHERPINIRAHSKCNNSTYIPFLPTKWHHTNSTHTNIT